MNKKEHCSIALTAHVDAGKTTLAESMLYTSGSIRKLGRVDHKDTFLDTYELERERGITIFSKQAELTLENKHVTLIDTPGHVDFSAEMERTLQVMDYVILVISGSDGVQGHVRTLWRLFDIYNIPVFIFVNKMDQDGTDRDSIMRELKSVLSEECVCFSEEHDDAFYEEVATSDEAAMEEYFENGIISDETISELIKCRKIYPCFFGSALRLTGVEEFMQGLDTYTSGEDYKDEFGAKVYKISRDTQGNRLTHMKITGGNIKAKMVIGDQKVNQIRIYSGDSYEAVSEAYAGMVCAVTGLDSTFSGQGLGIEKDSELPVLEPVLIYSLILPNGCNVHDMFTKLRELEEEEPELHIVWNEQNNEIQAKLMGEIQIEVLKRIIRERYDVEIEFGTGSIVYKETIVEPTEGVGHYEPLRHYAEAHILMEPGERGSGIQIDSACREEDLAINWQRLIMTHLEEKAHVGVLTGSEITDIKMTIVAGRAHLKHTEGGDFRQASYRAVRHGLMKAKCIVLEPVYEYILEIPTETIGRAMTDIQKMSGSFETPETDGDKTVLRGTAPVATMQGYQIEVASYTKGMGKLACTLKGYEKCHNQEEVIEKMAYNPEADIANPSGSVFCSHGAGFYVTWDQVENHMHVESGLGTQIKSEVNDELVSEGVNAPIRNSYYEEPETYQAVSLHGFADKALEDIFVKTYGPISHKKETISAKKISYDDNSEQDLKYKKNKKNEIKENYLLVDGYNIIYAWDELKALAEVNLESARTKLMDILCNYQGYRQMTLILVFDAYRVKGNPGEITKYNNIHVVYTKEAETADQYIEKTVHKIGRKHNVTVATSDALEQVIIFGQGAVRMSANGLKDDVELVNREIREHISD